MKGKGGLISFSPLVRTRVFEILPFMLTKPAPIMQARF